MRPLQARAPWVLALLALLGCHRPVAVFYDGGMTSEATFTASPTSFTFPSTRVGDTSAPARITLANIDFRPSGPVSHVIQDSVEFGITGSTCGPPLPVKGECRVSVMFKPLSPGEQKMARLSFTIDRKTFTVLLFGSSKKDPLDAAPDSAAPDSVADAPDALPDVAPRVDEPLPPSPLRLEPASSFRFEDTALATWYRPVPLVHGKGFGLFNDGNVLVMASGGARISGPNAGEFQVSVDRCVGTSLPPQGRCMITLVFRPTSAGLKEALLEVDYGGGQRAAVGLRGLAVEPSWLALDPAEALFDLAVGQRSTVAFEVVNVGQLASEPPEVTFRGPDGDQFIAEPQPGCAAPLPPRGRCAIKLTFAPTSPGFKTASLRVSTLPTEFTEAVLQAHAFMPQGQLALTRTSLRASTAAVGDIFSTLFSVRNIGSASTGMVSAGVSGPDAADFSVAASCQPLAPGASCPLTVHFVPTAAGARDAFLEVKTQAGATATWPLRGTGLAPQGIFIAISERQLGIVPVNGQGFIYSFEVRVPVGFAGTTGPIKVGFEGLDKSSFQIGNDTCSNATLSNAQARCTFQVQMSPASTGAKAAALMVSASPGGAARVALTGAGI